MSSLQYVIDSICSSVTVESIHGLIGDMLSRDSFGVDDIVPEIQKRDRSLDTGSARQIAEAAVNELEELGELKVEGETVYPLQKKS